MKWGSPSIQQKYSHTKLRMLERVFRCCSVCETMENYKEGNLMVWTNYVSLQLYFWAILWGTRDVISVTMATHKVHKNVH